MKKYDFYISPSGNDDFEGSENKPFATLDRARDAVREKLDSGKKGEIKVGIGGGAYLLTETLVFGMRDSAPEGVFVSYEALPGQTPVFSSGAPVSGWKKVDGLLPGAPEETRDKIWSADLPAGLDRCNTLYDEGGLLPRAAEPPFLFDPDRETEDFTTFYFKPGTMKDDPAVRSGDIEVRVIPKNPWVANILPVEHVDSPAGEARTAIPATYPMTTGGNHAYLEKMGLGAVEVQNTFAGLRNPGNWAVRSRERKIYLWPAAGEEPRGITAPVLTELIRIEGSIDYDGPQDTPVRGISFKGLVFSRADRFSWEKGRTGNTLQHEWEMFDRPTALARLRGAEECVFGGCSFRDSGGAGIRLDLHARKNRVERCEFSGLGGAGVVLAGYGPGKKDVNRENTISDNRISGIGILLWHSAGIFAWQSGDNRIEHNLIHNVPYCAIIIGGRIIWDKNGGRECSRTVRWGEVGEASGEEPWEVREKYLHGRRCIVEYNEIHNCMEKLGDGNAIYISGTGRYVEVKNNYIHDINGPLINSVIRCDDDQYTVLIENNLIENCVAEAFTWKGLTTLRNNIVIGLSLNSIKPKRGLWVIPYCNREGGEIGSVVEKNVLLSHDPGVIIKYDGENRRTHAARPRGFYGKCRALNNLYWNTSAPETCLRHLREQHLLGNERGSVAEDPEIRIGRGTALFEDSSPAAGLGIKPVDLSCAGPRGKQGAGVCLPAPKRQIKQ